MWQWWLRTYLEAPGMYLTTQGQILVFSLGKINRSQGAEHLPNNVISGIAVKAQYHKVQCDALYRQTTN
jgi:hypothetical protein